MAELRTASRASRLILRCAREQAMANPSLTSLGLPFAVGETASGTDFATACLGPDEWLLTMPTTKTDAVRQAVMDALSSQPHALVDISDRDIGLLLTGEAVEEILASGCPLDLAAFPAGRAVRTVFNKAPILLWRIDPSTFRLEVERSFESYIRDLLRIAIDEVGADSGALRTTHEENA
ncbi:MAG: sarcosine oxidase subunit gamma family protein [Rhizomicrobium sp.]